MQITVEKIIEMLGKLGYSNFVLNTYIIGWLNESVDILGFDVQRWLLMEVCFDKVYQNKCFDDKTSVIETDNYKIDLFIGFISQKIIKKFPELTI